jgi:hypothetical protein
MLLQQIFSLVNQNARFKLHEDQYPILATQAQQLAFDRDITAFLKTDAVLTVLFEITFLSAGYVSAIASDIGKAIVGGTSGAGTLISYNNTTRVWVVSIGLAAEKFIASETITITTGTGAGTLAATDFLVTHKGPYAYPTDTPVRKMVGVTTVSASRIFGVDATYISDRDDYGINLDTYNTRRFFVPANQDRFTRTFTFVNPPTDTLDDETVTYRWWYYRRPPTIASSTDDANLIIPEEYHFHLVQMMIRLAQISTEDGKVTENDKEELYREFWDGMWKNYTPQGENSSHFNEGNL